MGRTFTDPSVLAGIAAGASWADPEMDPTRIDWAGRQAAAAIPFRVIDGRPVKPGASTGIRYGRNELGHWGEQRCADAFVTATAGGLRWIVMVERADGHGWALPGGYVDAGEHPVDAAIRELAEETGLMVDRDKDYQLLLPSRVVPDPRGSDEAWMVTTPVAFDLGDFPDGALHLPRLSGADDAKQAGWTHADTFSDVMQHLMLRGGEVFAAHRDLLSDLLG